MIERFPTLIEGLKLVVILWAVLMTDQLYKRRDGLKALAVIIKPRVLLASLLLLLTYVLTAVIFRRLGFLR